MPRSVARAVAPLLRRLIGSSLPLQVRFWDGSAVGPSSETAVIMRSPNALRRLLSAPGELGLGRAYVAGELDIEGDLGSVIALGERLGGVRLGPMGWLAALRAAAAAGALRGGPLSPPP